MSENPGKPQNMSRRKFLRKMFEVVGTSLILSQLPRTRQRAEAQDDQPITPDQDQVLNPESNWEQETDFEGRRKQLARMVEQLNYLKRSNPERYTKDNVTMYGVHELTTSESLQEWLERDLSPEEIETLMLMDDINQILDRKQIAIRFSYEDANIADGVKPEIPAKQALLISML